MTDGLTGRMLAGALDGWLAAGLFPRQRGLISSLFVAGFTGCGIIFYILERIFDDLGSTQCAPSLAVRAHGAVPCSPAALGANGMWDCDAGKDSCMRYVFPSRQVNLSPLRAHQMRSCMQSALMVLTTMIMMYM